MPKQNHTEKLLSDIRTVYAWPSEKTHIYLNWINGWTTDCWKELAGHLCLSHLCFITFPSRNLHAHELSAYSSRMPRVFAWQLPLKAQQCCTTYWAGSHRWIDIRFWGSAMPTDTTISAAHPWAHVSHISTIQAETLRQHSQASKWSDRQRCKCKQNAGRMASVPCNMVAVCWIGTKQQHQCGATVLQARRLWWLTQTFPDRQVDLDDILLAKQKDISHINMVCGDIHTEQLYISMYVLQWKAKTRLDWYTCVCWSTVNLLILKTWKPQRQNSW